MKNYTIAVDHVVEENQIIILGVVVIIDCQSPEAKGIE